MLNRRPSSAGKPLPQVRKAIPSPRSSVRRVIVTSEIGEVEKIRRAAARRFTERRASRLIQRAIRERANGRSRAAQRIQVWVRSRRVAAARERFAGVDASGSSGSLRVDAASTPVTELARIGHLLQNTAVTALEVT